MFLQSATPADGNMSTDGVEYMDTGPDIGGSIAAIQGFDHLCEQIFSGHDIRSQVLPVGPERRDDQKDRHTGKKVGTGSVVF